MLTIYHNPRCSKSRQTLQLIEAANAEHQVVEYLKTPLSETQLRQLAAKLGVSPIDMMRTKEAEFKEQALKGADDDALFAAMANTPKLMERPIVVNAEQAIIGRPPENVNTLL